MGAASHTGQVGTWSTALITFGLVLWAVWATVNTAALSGVVVLTVVQISLGVLLNGSIMHGSA